MSRFKLLKGKDKKAVQPEQTAGPRNPFGRKELLSKEVAVQSKIETSVTAKTESKKPNKELTLSQKIAGYVIGSVCLVGGIVLIADAVINVSTSTGMEGIIGAMGLFTGGMLLKKTWDGTMADNKGTTESTTIQ